MFRFRVHNVFSLCFGERPAARQKPRLCSFCLRDAQPMVEGVAGVLICKECSEVAVSMLQTECSRRATIQTTSPLTSSSG